MLEISPKQSVELGGVQPTPTAKPEPSVVMEAQPLESCSVGLEASLQAVKEKYAEGCNMDVLIGEVVKSAKAQGPATKAAAGATEKSEEEMFLESAAELGGKFDLQRSSIGKRWSRSLQRDPGLKEAYAACGRSYNAQRAFRQKWVDDALAVEKSRRQQTERFSTSDMIGGEYLPASVICKREGADADAMSTTIKYVQRCNESMQNGITMNGREFVLWNDMTQRHEFLYCRRKYNERYDMVFEQTHTEAEKVGVGSAGEQKRTGEPATATPRQLKVAKVADGAPSDKKVMDGQLAKARALKARHDCAMNGFNEISSNIAGGKQEWSWAAAPALTAELHESKRALDAFKASHDVWGSWAILPDFAANSRKLFDRATLAEQMTRLPQLEKVLDDLSESIQVILSMQAARSRKW